MTTIIIRNSTTAAHVPAPGALALGEIAVNVTDAKIYAGAGTASPAVQLLGAAGPPGPAGAVGPPGPPGPPGPA